MVLLTEPIIFETFQTPFFPFLCQSRIKGMYHFHFLRNCVVLIQLFCSFSPEQMSTTSVAADSLFQLRDMLVSWVIIGLISDKVKAANSYDIQKRWSNICYEIGLPLLGRDILRIFKKKIQIYNKESSCVDEFTLPSNSSNFVYRV